MSEINVYRRREKVLSTELASNVLDIAQIVKLKEADTEIQTNHKRKRKKKIEATPIAYFCEVITLTQGLGKIHVQILLKWLLGDFFLTNHAIDVFFGGRIMWHMSKFYAGYHDLRESNSWKLYYSCKEWMQISYMIENRYSLTNVRSQLCSRIRKFRHDPQVYIKRKGEHYKHFGEQRMSIKDFKRKSLEFLNAYNGYFLIEEGIEQPESKNEKIIWKCIPSNFYTMQASTTIECWKDRCTGELIGGRMRGGFPLVDRAFARSCMEDVWNSKWVVSRGPGKLELHHTMRAVGPLVNWREGKGLQFVSHYRNKVKMSKTAIADTSQLEVIHEQCFHRLLFEMILVSFCDNFFPVAEDFMKLKYPYSELSPDLMRCFNYSEKLKHTVPAYPMFITKNYCNMLHTDADRSAFTMFMVSNPSMRTSGGYLVNVDYGINVPLLDGDLIFGRGNNLHCTSYRPPSKDAVIVVGIALNEKIGHAYDFVNKDV